MPEIITTCTRCQRQLRVPEELQGRLVKCPACETTFTASRSEPAPAREQLPRPSFEAPVPGQSERQPPPFSQPVPPQPRRDLPFGETESQVRPLLLGPAICLIILGLLGVLGSAYVAVAIHVMEPEMTAQFLRDWQRQQGAQPPPPPELIFGIFKYSHGACVLISLLVLVAGIQMLRLKTYGFVFMGSILAMLDFGCGCCVLGAPIGIWSLIILCRPGVSAMFR